MLKTPPDSSSFEKGATVKGKFKCVIKRLTNTEKTFKRMSHFIIINSNQNTKANSNACKVLMIFLSCELIVVQVVNSVINIQFSK